ncbi:MAG TPA: hypothetical protein DF712_13050, partial [Balneola sp.]|nr:hypothetical protein [Balneola sp.]
MNILIVEDNPHDLELILNELKRCSFEWAYQHCDTENDIIDALKQESIDLVICDFNVPSLSCIDVLSTVHALNKDIPFFIVSGFIGEDQAVDLIV